ncbi:MAG: anti-sigma factor antagonist [Desulfobacteraceae bacterium]|nr:MAG: anti-sigma factor antagonist [Desulfobacteraceae bacterium]
MEIKENMDGNIHVFELSGRLDSRTSPEFDEKLFKAMEQGASHFIIDFQSLEYISSAGLRVLNKAHKKLKHSDGKIMMCNMVDYIKEVFEIAGFDTFLPIVPDRQAARNSFN